MIDRIETLVGQFERKEITRRQLIGALLATAVTSSRPAAAAEPVMQGHQINHITLGVKDINRSRAFYERLLGAKLWYDGSKTTGFYDLGLGGPSFISVSQQVAPGFNHFCVGISNFDVDKAAAEVKKAFPDQNPQPQKVSRPDGSTLAWPSFSIKDPDGYSLQLGDAKYQLDGRR